MSVMSSDMVSESLDCRRPEPISVLVSLSAKLFSSACYQLAQSR